MNSNQENATPWNFFKAVEAFFGITFAYDMAASPDNAKCKNYCTEKDNSLSFQWPTDRPCWLNPPFRKLSKFIPKCAEEKARGAKIVSIWPLSGDYNQLPAWIESDVYVIHGRIWPEVRGLMLCRWDEHSCGIVRGLTWDKKVLKQIWGEPNASDS